jgi:peptidoglycan hydrolase CwlO-like protein
MNRHVIMTAYHQGPEAVINLFVETYAKQELRIHELERRNKQLEETIQKLETHIQELEASRKKKTPQTAINLLQLMGFESPSRKACGEKQVV